jgi:hypothetical protein
MSSSLRMDELYFPVHGRTIPSPGRSYVGRQGQPKLWVTVYDRNQVTVWVEVAYGGE